MRDLAFLFGAGASHGAGGILPEAPPLGSQLFGYLENFFPATWGSLPPDAKDSFVLTGNFEVGMQRIYERYGFAIPQLMRDMATYFIQFRIADPACRYAELVRDTLRLSLMDRCAFSTLNYECLLELAFSKENSAFCYFDDNAVTPIWKLHGSCNFFSAGLQVGQGISYGTGIVFEGGLRAFASADEVTDHCLNQTGLAPAMSLYMKGKPLAISPSTIAEIQRLWATNIAGASALFVIGVLPNLQDEHIWGPIARSRANLYFIGDQMAFESWKNVVGKSNATHIGRRFSESYHEILNKLKSYGTHSGG